MNKKSVLSLKKNGNDTQKLLSDKFKTFVKNKNRNKTSNLSRKQDNTLSEVEKKRRFSAIQNNDSSVSFLDKSSINQQKSKIEIPLKSLVSVQKVVDLNKKRKIEPKKKKNKIDESIENEIESKKVVKKAVKNFDTSVEDILEDDFLKGVNIQKDVLNFISQPKKKKKNTPSVLKNQKASFIAKKIPVPSSGVVCSDLAHRIQIDISKIQESLYALTGNVKDKMTKEEAEIIIKEFGHKPIFNDIESILYDTAVKVDIKPPVISIMGHVDHGKTSIIDRMRKTSVVESEVGGITQKVSAYSFEKNGRKLTLVDTPGHEIFKEMRMNGAKFTDMVILVVAADDGVKEQTVESIKYAKNSGVPMVVIINKIDKKNVNKDKIRRDLMNHDVVLESMGGEILEIEVSAKTGEGFDKLYETIFLQADILELKTHKGRANGIVIDSFLDKGRGIVTTVIVKDGILRDKNLFVSENDVHRVKSMFVGTSKMKESHPSSAVSLLGFNKIVNIGETFHVIDSEKDAKIVMATEREEDKQEIRHSFSFLKKKTLNLIIKGNTAASVSAIKEGIEGLKNEDIDLKIVYSAVGDINEGDIASAETCGAKIFGFSIKNSTKKNENVKIYNIIYELLDEVKLEIRSIVGDKFNETVLGQAKITHVFNMKDDSGKSFRVAGGVVIDRSITNENEIIIRSKRNGKVVIDQGTIKSLEMKRISVNEVKKNQEFGLVLKNQNNIEVGDLIDCIKRVKIN